MATQTQQISMLPIIKLPSENLIPGTNSWISTSNDVRAALEQYGCFLIDTDKISPNLRNTMFRLSKQLYHLPMETKIKITSEILGFGYGGNFSTLPLLEYFGADVTTFEATQNFTNILWPNSSNTTFGENLFEYTKMLRELDEIVMRMVCGSYGMDEHSCDGLVGSSLHMARFMKYRRPEKDQEEAELETGLHPHTDKTFSGVLDSNEVKGLEIETRDGEWISYEPSPSTFVVIAGEAFMAWSNGRIHAPVHRVMMRYGKEEVRYSIGVFSFMRNTIEVPKELLDVEDDALKFKPFSHLEFLQYCAGERKKVKWAIKDYCGTTAA